MEVHERFFLYTTPDKFVFEPCTADGSVKAEACLVIDRVSREIEVNLFYEKSAAIKPMLVYGLFGIIHLTAGPYLIVITGAECVGTITQHKIWKVTATEVLPYVHTLLHLNEVQMQDNTVLLDMLHAVLNFESFYYSTSFDVTHSLQRLNNTSPEFRTMPLLERADLRFTWNYHLMKDLIESAQMAKMQNMADNSHFRFALPIMMGYVEISEYMINDHFFKLALVSRRSCNRAGVRFQTRGIDSEGNAANFVETEQILEYGSILCSFIQTRGSIPLRWSQKPNLRWQPWPKLQLDDDPLKTFRYHMASQFYTYGYQVIISLLNQCGREKDIGAAFKKVFAEAKLSGFKFVSFDFHKECRNLNWNRLNDFVDSLREDMFRLGYFVSKKDDPTYNKQQEGVFRTNCMDCLDRTNVVQSLIARNVLESQLKWLQILTKMDSVKNHTDFLAAYKNLWADNGNVCSVQYAGTGALKDDFTRSGKRTVAGALKDGYNAITRWYINNFMDGFRQDAIDLFLGNHTYDDFAKLKYSEIKRSIWLTLVPVAFLFCICMLLLSVIIGSDNLYLYVTTWSFSLIVLSFIILWHGEEIADRPKLRNE